LLANRQTELKATLAEIEATIAAHEAHLQAHPDDRAVYWQLGIALILSDREAEAQTLWLSVLFEADDPDAWSAELFEAVVAAADDWQALGQWEFAWTLRHHAIEILPEDLANRIAALELSLDLVASPTQTQMGDPNLLWETIEQAIEPLVMEIEAIAERIDSEDLGDSVSDPVSNPVSDSVSDSGDSENLSDWITSLNNSGDSDDQAANSRNFEDLGDLVSDSGDSGDSSDSGELFTDIIYPIAHATLRLGITLHRPDLAQPLTDALLACAFLPLDLRRELLRHSVSFYQGLYRYPEAIAQAEQSYNLCETLPDRIFANYQLLQCLLGAGAYWEQAQTIAQRQINLIETLLTQNPQNLDASTALRLLTTNLVWGYLSDRPAEDRPRLNRLAALCQANLRRSYAPQFAPGFQPYPDPLPENLSPKDRSPVTAPPNSPQKQPSQPTAKLRIGYLSDSLKQHSVGWLARWLIQHYDRDRFEVFLYLINTATGVQDDLQQWFIKRADRTVFCDLNCLTIAQQIQADQIQILIDLDSLTVDIACGVMALKPAPVQCTWLGFDASGLPAIDYYIADALTLPKTAQRYYQETIWHLPQTYIAIDGFEIEIPTLNREQLGIADDAIVYLSQQTGYKRNPQIMRRQLEILQQVDRAQLLIKGWADQTALRSQFSTLALEMGIDPQRLHFLPQVRSEAEHRANLTIADIILDTYPYNGATTTLEALWMGIPLVTRVGEQFSGRNSYAMLQAVGVTEGIAWTDEEYVAWGVRLGQEPELRDRIAWQLRRSRQSSPLWNAQVWIHDWEAMLTAMWERFENALGTHL